MRRLRNQMIWLWSVSLLVCAAWAITGDAPAKPGPETRARSTLQGTATPFRILGVSGLPIARTSPAQSGVKLLEDILGRVRSVPQVAMNVKQTMQNKRQEIAQQAQQGPTNYQLAIRPNESSWRQQQRLNVAGQKAGSLAEPKGGLAAKPKLAKTRGFWEKESDDDSFAFYAPSQRRNDVIASGGSRSGYQPRAAASGNGIWEAEADKKAQLTPSQERLKNAAGKLYDLSRKIESANEIASNYAPSYGGGYGSAAGGGYGSSAGTGTGNAVRSGTAVRGALMRGSGGVKKDQLERTRWYSAPREMQIINDAPIVRDYRSQPAEEITIQVPQQHAAQSALPPPPPLGWQAYTYNRSMPAAPPAPSAAPGITTNINQLPPTRLQSSVSDVALGEQNYGDEGQFSSREAKVAMLPPNVFTGIPMVRLGSSEKQASRALAASGGMERTRINGWTVLTFFKPRTKEPALQVYMRHGQVDALRTFDASMVGSDFGVRLGDSLAAVKERFGEPAFIISEPTPGSGQNYVYPISQVAFLMARQSPSEAPQVTGLFIFNVK